MYKFLGNLFIFKTGNIYSNLCDAFQQKSVANVVNIIISGAPLKVTFFAAAKTYDANIDSIGNIALIVENSTEQTMITFQWTLGLHL